jgi:hypothetical protein
MEAIVPWSILIQYGGGLGVLVFLVVMFLKHMHQTTKDFSDTVKGIHGETLVHQKTLRDQASQDSRALRECIEDNSKLMGRACSILDRHDQLLARIESRNS